MAAEGLLLVYWCDFRVYSGPFGCPSSWLRGPLSPLSLTLTLTLSPPMWVEEVMAVLISTNI